MASDQTYVDFVVGQIKNAGEIMAKKMFGEYGLFSDWTISEQEIERCTGRGLAMLARDGQLLNPIE